MIKYKRKKSHRSFMITCGLLVLLIVFSHRNPAQSRLPSAVINTVITPVNSVFYSIASAIQDTYDNLFGKRAAHSQIEQLQLENRKLTEQNMQLKNVVDNQAFLSAEYELLRHDGSKYIQATISSKDGSNTFTRFNINRGSLNGVAVGDIVVEGVKVNGDAIGEGLVGRVIEVGPDYATVSSILDQANNLSVFFEGTQTYGVINGRDSEFFSGYLLKNDAAVEKGHAVFTSGIGGIYPRGIYVGTIAETKLSDDELTKNFTMRSPVDFHRLYRVLVIPAKREQ